MEVFIAKAGKRSGPFTPFQIRGKYDRGTLRPEDHIWFEGAENWLPASWILERKEFEKATRLQKDAFSLLGVDAPKSLTYTDAERLIHGAAREQGREKEIQTWLDSKGATIYLVGPSGETSGPFPQALVTEWFSLSLIAKDAWIYIAWEEVWKRFSDCPGIYWLSDGVCRSGNVPHRFNSPDRYQKRSTQTQHTYLRHLGCPFATEQLDFHFADWIIHQLEGVFPWRADLAVRREIEDEGQDPNFWHADPATEKQIAYLETQDIYLDPGATKGEAAALIDPASDAQRRRLNFYGTRLPQHLTKQYASTLIDAHIRKHPESEEQYQQWKRDNGF